MIDKPRFLFDSFLRNSRKASRFAPAEKREREREREREKEREREIKKREGGQLILIEKEKTRKRELKDREGGAKSRNKKV
jgi:hypothetical protein